MAKLPIAQEQVVFSGARTALPQVQQGSSGALAQALTQWSAQRAQQKNEEALQRVGDAAVRAQSMANLASRATGVGLIVDAPEGTTGVFREAFQQKARAVFGADMAARATRAAADLSRKHNADPDGFAQEYNAWMAPQVEALREVDAESAFELQQRLDGLGLQHQQRLIEQAAGVAQETERASLFSSLSDLVSTLQDDLLSSPDAELLAQGEETIAEQLAEARAGGLISASQEASELQRSKLLLTQQYARGRFNAAVNANDIGGAMGVIRSIRAGALFDDNEQGQAFADRLERELAPAKNTNEDALKRARRTIDAAEAFGTPMDNEQLAEAMQLIALEGSEDDLDKLARFRTSMQVREQFSESINQMSMAGLAAQEQRLRDNPAQFNTETGRALLTMIKQRRETLANADAAGNLLNPADLQLQSFSTPEERAAVARQVQLARLDSQQAYGESLDMIPLASDRMVSQAADELAQARAAGDAERAAEVIEQLMVAANDVHERANVALTAGQPELAGYAMMAALDPQGASNLFGMALQGAGASQQRRDAAIDILENTGVAEDILEVADLMSGGRPAVRDDLEVDLRNAAVALAAEFETRGLDVSSMPFATGLRKEFRAMLEPFRQSVKLESGAVLPRATVTDAEVQVLNETLMSTEQQVRLFGTELDPVTLATLTPHPLPDGQWAFRSSRSGRLARGPDGEIATLEARDKVQAIEDEELFAQSGVVSRAMGGRTPVQQAIEVDIPAVAEVMGGDRKLLTAVFRAGVKLPAEERVDREYTMLWAKSNADLLDRVAYERAWADATQRSFSVFSLDPRRGPEALLGPAPDPAVDPVGAQVAALMLMDMLHTKYGDAAQAAAAYYVGYQAVDEAGDEWDKRVPTEAHEFTERVRAAMP